MKITLEKYKNIKIQTKERIKVATVILLAAASLFTYHLSFTYHNKSKSYYMHQLELKKWITINIQEIRKNQRSIKPEEKYSAKEIAKLAEDLKLDIKQIIPMENGKVQVFFDNIEFQEIYVYMKKICETKSSVQKLTINNSFAPGYIDASIVFE